jgi:predicted nucleic acid-binding Zn ribbon protein
VEYYRRVEWFITWKFLHIAAMFFGVALAISGELVVRRVAGQRDVAAIRTTVRTVRPLSGTGATVFFVAGLAFGVLAALAGQIDLLAPWLISAYVAFGLAMLIGLTVTDPWVSRLEGAAAASPTDAPSDELVEVIEDARARAATAALMFLILALIFIMVVKPFGW